MPTLQELHEFAVEEGIKEDPRDREQIEDLLDEREDQYEELEGVRKEQFDEDKLENPFDDCKVLYGGEEDVKTVAVGIDIELQDLVLVDRLNEQGASIDGVVAHHPQGRASPQVANVMELTVDLLVDAGVPVSKAESVINERAEEVGRGYHVLNHPRSVQAADRLDLPFMCSHTITDNHASQFMADYFEEQDPYTLDELIEVALEIPEYQWAVGNNAGPQVWSGSEDNRAGAVEVLGFTGGTSPGDDAIEEAADAGVDTFVAMHATRDQIEKAQEEGMNLVVMGHMASDSLGMNLLLDKAQEEFDLAVEALSGFKRVER